MSIVNVILTIAAVITALGVIGGIFFSAYKIIKTFKKIDRLDTENGIIIKTELAICDGLSQLGANGPVTKARTELNEYLINNRGEK